MASVVFVPNDAGYQEVLVRSAGLVQNAAQQVAGSAMELDGCTYVVDATEYHAKNRPVSKIRPSGYKSIKSNIEHDTLVKALGSVRL